MSEDRLAKRRRIERSAMPSPAPITFYDTVYVVDSRLVNVITDTRREVVIRLPATTAWERLEKVSLKVACQRIRRFPRAWVGTAVTITRFVGSKAAPLAFSNTEGFSLGMYPRDTDGRIYFHIFLANRTVPISGMIRLMRTTSAAEHTTLGIVAGGGNNSTGRPIQQTQVRRRRPESKRISLEIRFPGLHGLDEMIPVTMAILPNANFGTLTTEFAKKIESVVKPEYLRCLLRWRSEIGTDEDGFKPAQAGKILSDYPGATRGQPVAKILAGLVEPTLQNLRREEPEMLKVIPSLGQFTEWMNRIGEKAGYARDKWYSPIGNPELGKEIGDLQLEKAKEYEKHFDKLVAKALQ